MSCSRQEFKALFIDTLATFFGANKLPSIKCEKLWEKLSLHDAQTLKETADWVILNFNPTVVPAIDKISEQASAISLRKRRIVKDEFDGPCSRSTCNGSGMVLTKRAGQIVEVAYRCPCEIGSKKWTGFPVYTGQDRRQEKNYVTRNEHISKGIDE